MFCDKSFFCKGVRLLTLYAILYTVSMSPIWRRCNLLFIWVAVPSVDLRGIGCRIKVSKIMPSFHNTSLLWKYGMLGFSLLFCVEVVMHKMIL